jgi:hypothetical protein
VVEWVDRLAEVPVHLLNPGSAPRLPRKREVLVGGPDQVHELGVGKLDLVGIIDADLASGRPGLSSRDRALTTWFEAVSWARPAGRAIVQSSHASDPAIQALVRGNPARYHQAERERRERAGFPVGSAVFKVAGKRSLVRELEVLDPITLLASAAGGQTVCLLAIDPGRVIDFGERVRGLATRGVVYRVEAEPHL